MGKIKDIRAAVSNLLNAIERAEAQMRARKLYAVLPDLARVFETIDNPELKINEEQYKSVLVYVDDILSAKDEYYVSFVKYTCEEIVKLLVSDFTTDSEMQQKHAEHRIKKCDAGINSIKARLAAGADSADEIKLTSALKNLEEEKDTVLSELKYLLGDKGETKQKAEPTPVFVISEPAEDEHPERIIPGPSEELTPEPQKENKFDEGGFIVGPKNKGNAKRIEQLKAAINSYHFPKDVDHINDALHYICRNEMEYDEGDLILLLDRWVREAKNTAIGSVKDQFLKGVALCARKYDENNHANVFYSLWENTEDIIYEYEDCEKVLDRILISGRSNYGEIMTHLLPFFKRGENYKTLTNFFKKIFTVEDDGNGEQLVDAAWRNLLCNRYINEAMMPEDGRNYFATKEGMAFAREIDRHRGKGEGRELPPALVAYREKKSAAKKRFMLISAAAVAVVAIAICLATYFRNTGIDSSTIAFADLPSEKILSYGEELDLTMGKITYNTNNGAAFEIEVTKAMYENSFNPNKVGEQTVKVSFGGKYHTVKVTVNPITLVKPVARFEGGFIKWNAVDGAGSYNLVVTDTDGNVIVPGTNVEDKTEWLIPDTITFGAYSVTVSALKSNNTYEDSEASDPVAFEKREGITEITYEDGTISWNEVPGASAYRVILNGEELNANGTSIARALKGGSNEITVSAVYGGAVIYTNKTVTVKKLTDPSLTISNKKVICNDSGVVLYLDGTEFDGDLAGITEPGEYLLTAQRFPTKAGEIASDMIAPITITKLPTPTLTIENNRLKLDKEGYDVRYYLNGTEFSGNILDVATPDTYTVTAKFKARNSLELDSEVSNAQTFTKLSVPKIDYDIITKSVVVTDAADKYELYLNGEVFDGNVKNLGAGYFTVTARNVGDGVTSISSAESNPLYISNADAEIIIADQGDGSVKIIIDTEITNLKYDIQVKFYDDGGDYIDSWQKTGATAKSQKVLYNRGGGKVASKLEITVVLIPPSDEFGTETIEETWERT